MREDGTSNLYAAVDAYHAALGGTQLQSSRMPSAEAEFGLGLVL
jgi:hypothetical protein